MSSLIATASALMSASERRVEVIANNIANVSTPGYRRQVSYAESFTSALGLGATVPQIRTRTDESEGRLTATNNPMDVAISGEGFFQLRGEGGFVYSRHGQFRHSDDGTLVDAHGRVVQQTDGGDLLLDSAEVEILVDGTVVSDERPIGRIALFAAADGAVAEPLSGTTFAIADAALREVEDPQLRQGMVETSNVVLGDEMVTMMAAMRQAETGARLATTYDELMGRAITTLGQSR